MSDLQAKVRSWGPLTYAANCTTKLTVAGTRDQVSYVFGKGIIVWAIPGKRCRECGKPSAQAFSQCMGL